MTAGTKLEYLHFCDIYNHLKCVRFYTLADLIKSSSPPFCTHTQFLTLNMKFT